MNYNPYSLEGKTILITGASSGIGRTTAIECSKLGAHCILTARNEERLKETIAMLAGEGHAYIVADLTNAADLETLVSNVPTLDGLVNNAGIATTKLVSFLKQSDLDKLFATNTFAPVLLTKYLVKNNKINNGGSIVFTSSIASMCSSLGNANYGMTKSAIAAFSRYCAFEFAGKKIRVNSVHPGMVNTEMVKQGVYSDEELAEDVKKYPLKRYGEPEDIAWAMIYLLSDASSWVTGTNMVIDGGFTLN